MSITPVSQSSLTLTSYVVQDQPAGPSYSRAIFPVFNNPFSPAAIAAADKRARQRFALTLVLGFLLWLVLGLFVGVVGGEGAAIWGDHPYDSRWPGALEPIPEADGHVLHCADFLKTLPTAVIVLPPTNKGQFVLPGQQHAISSHEQPNERTTLNSGDWGGDDGRQHTIYKSKVYFHVPISSEDGFFTLARGRYSAGPIRYVLEEPQSPRDSPTDDEESSTSSNTVAQPKIEIEVVAKWNDKELLKSSKVCALSKHSNSTHRPTEYGVGIYTPSHDFPGAYRHLSFETVIRIPPSGLRSLRSLELEGSMFSPVEINLSPVTFGKAHFNISNGVVRAQSKLIASSIDMHTSNGAIEGQFSVSERLLLQSSNGRIDAHVGLVKADEATDTSHIVVKAHSTNGNVYVDYTDHPQGVVLASSAKTTNGDAVVTHQPTFEGSFSVRAYPTCPRLEYITDCWHLLQLSTSWGKGTVQSSHSSKDPTGSKRKRHFEITSDKSNFGLVKKEGRIYWGDSWKNVTDEMKGDSVVSTTLGTASLDFL